MIQKHKSFLIVWFLALLQCFAPLLHAHAGSLHGSGDVHIHLDALNIGAAQPRTEFHMDLCDSPTVSAPSEFKRDQYFSGDDLVIAVNILSQPALPAAARLHFVPTVYVPGFHKPTPPAQAPPTATRFL